MQYVFVGCFFFSILVPKIRLKIDFNYFGITFIAIVQKTLTRHFKAKYKNVIIQSLCKCLKIKFFTCSSPVHDLFNYKFLFVRSLFVCCIMLNSRRFLACSIKNSLDFLSALICFFSLFARGIGIFFKNIFAKRTVFVIVGIAIFVPVFHFAFFVFKFVYTRESKIALTFYRVACCGFKKRTFCEFILITCHWVLLPCNKIYLVGGVLWLCVVTTSTLHISLSLSVIRSIRSRMPLSTTVFNFSGKMFVV